MLNLILELRELLGDGLALLSLLGVLFGRDGLVDIVNGASLKETFGISVDSRCAGPWNRRPDPAG